MSVKHLPPRVFVTGTNTGIGKTVFSAVLMAGLRGTYWKPVQSGLEETTDTEWIRNATGLPENRFMPETYRLKRPLSPHASAAKEGVGIELEAFQMPEASPLVVEGAGGIMVPLNDRHFMLDLMVKLGLPVILVSSSELGTINHTMLSLERLGRSGLEVVCVVMNGPKNETNRKAVEFYGKVDVWEMEPLQEIDPKILENRFESYLRRMEHKYKNGQ